MVRGEGQAGDVKIAGPPIPIPPLEQATNNNRTSRTIRDHSSRMRRDDMTSVCVPSQSSIGYRTAPHGEVIVLMGTSIAIGVGDSKASQG